MPLSLGIGFKRSVGTCGCGFHGGLTSVVVHSGEVSDETKPACAACQEVEAQKVILMTAESRLPNATSKRVRKLSQKQEREVMAELGGRVMPGSGNQKSYKGDGRIFNKVRVEMKEVFGSAFSLSREVLNKIRGECAGQEEPVVVIDYKDKVTGRTEDRWAVVEFKVLKRLIDVSSKD